MRSFVLLQFFLLFVMGCFFMASVSYAEGKMTIRGGDHSGYSRLVFDWSNAPDYTLKAGDETLTLTFKGSGLSNTGGLPSNLRNIQSFKQNSDGDQSLTFSMAIPKGSKTRDFVIGNKVILDVYDGKSPISTSNAKETQTTNSQAEQPKALEKDQPEKKIVIIEKVEDDFSIQSLDKTTALPLGDVAKEPINPIKIEPHVITLTTVTNVGVAAFTRHGYLWIVTDAPDNATMPILEGPQKDKFKPFVKTDLKDGDVYSLELPDGMTAYAEGGGLSWRIHLTQNPEKEKGAKTVLPQRVVTDDHKKLKWPIKGLRKTIQYNDPFAGDDVVAITVNEAAQTSGKPKEYVDFVTLNNLVGFAYIAKDDDVSPKIALDGVIMDKTKGLTLLDEKDIQRESMRQEIAAEPEQEQKETPVTSDENENTNDLALKDPPPPSKAEEDIKKEIGEDQGQVKVDTVKGEDVKTTDAVDMVKTVKQKPSGNNIYNFPKWELGGIQSLNSNMQALMAQVAAKQQIDQTEDVITMAKLLLANNRATESLGMLRIALSQVPELEATPEFQSLQGAAYALSGKFDEAFTKFSSEKLKKYDDIKFWRAFTLAGLEDWKQAGELMPADISFLKTYPAQIRIPLALTFAEIALRNAKAAQANDILQILKPSYDSLSLSYKSAWDYLAGEAQRQTGDNKKAESYWTPLVKNGKDDLYRAKAGLSLTRLQIDNKTLKPNDAIDRLEGLRYAWRGDELETLINYRLSQLYFDNKDYLKALTVLRNATTMTPDLPIGQDVRTLMAKSFQDVFSNDRLSTMSPIEAISFYEEFKDLSPVGSAGDVYVEKLAERLVDAELLGRAAALLESHVNNRLQGTKKVDVAIRLAAIRLLDGNPDGALRSLEIAQNTLDKAPDVAPDSEKKPQDVAPQAGESVAKPENKEQEKPKLLSERQRQIYLLKARALSMQDKADEALLILEKMRNDADVNKLRTDIAWVAGKWEQAAMSLNDLILAEDISAKRPLNDYQRDIILNRAIALNLSGQRVALTNLRERFDAQMKATTKGQMFDVVSRPRRADLIGSREAIESMISEIDLFKGFLDGFSKTDLLNQPAESKKAEPAPAVTSDKTEIKK